MRLSSWSKLTVLEKPFQSRMLPGITPKWAWALISPREMSKRLKKQGHPWERAKAFDGSAVVGGFVAEELGKDIQSLSFPCAITTNWSNKVPPRCCFL